MKVDIGMANARQLARSEAMEILDNGPEEIPGNPAFRGRKAIKRRDVLPSSARSRS